MYALIFYLLAALIIATTALAITRRNLAHAVVCLVASFFGSALLFYLLGAPLLATLEVIIYAGAIMILFLFVVMMIRLEDPDQRLFTPTQLGFALVLVLVGTAVGSALLFIGDPGSHTPLRPAQAKPAAFGAFLFQEHWLAVEIASLLLLVALIGALVIGRERKPEEKANSR